MPAFTLTSLADGSAAATPWYRENIRAAFGRPSFASNDDRAYWFASISGQPPAIWVTNGPTIIKTLQALFNVYTAGPALTVDGIYGPKTQARLEAYARSRGVPEVTLRAWSGPGPMPQPLLAVALQLIVGKLVSAPGWTSWSRAISNTQTVPIVAMPSSADVSAVQIALPYDLDPSDLPPWNRRINNNGRDDIFAFRIENFPRFPTFAELGSALADAKYRWSIREMNAGRAPSGSSLKVNLRFPRSGGQAYTMGQYLEPSAPINAVVNTTVTAQFAAQPPEVEEAPAEGSGLLWAGAVAAGVAAAWWIFSGDKR